jgi:hypothetical protein
MQKKFRESGYPTVKKSPFNAANLLDLFKNPVGSPLTKVSLQVPQNAPRFAIFKWLLFRS